MSRWWEPLKKGYAKKGIPSREYLVQYGYRKATFPSSAQAKSFAAKQRSRGYKNITITRIK
jgi:hypothetical protein